MLVAGIVHSPGEGRRSRDSGLAPWRGPQALSQGRLYIAESSRDGNLDVAVAVPFYLQGNLCIADVFVADVFAGAIVDLAESIFIHIQSDEQTAALLKLAADHPGSVERNRFHPAGCQQMPHARVAGVA